MHYDLRRQLRSFGYALRGLRAALRTEQNLRTHLVVAAVVIAAGLVLGLSRTEWIAVTLCIGMVIAAELMNTAIERLVDFVSPERHPLAGLVKDLAAAAVLVTALAAAVVGLIVFGRFV